MSVTIQEASPAHLHDGTKIAGEETCKTSQGPGLTSLLLHSLGQNKSQSQPRTKGWRKSLYLSWDSLQSTGAILQTPQKV